jgi:hypothetical protein
MSPRGVRPQWLIAALLAVPLFVNGQQQVSNPQADWPCGARLDPSYFQVAEGTGGHLLLLSPWEVGDSATLLKAFDDHPQTIFRLAGSVSPGLHEFQIPIDPSVASVLFSISVQCLQTADVLRPSGASAGGDDVTEFSNFRAQRMLIVRRPEPGMWIVRVAGRGVSAVVVQAQSEMGITQVEFATSERITFSVFPAAGVENTVRIHLRGHAAELSASLMNGVFTRLVGLRLRSGETEGSYESRFTPGADGFRILVAGKDANGFAVQRMHAPLITAVR